MALIPLKQRAIVIRYGEENRWGEREIIERKEYKVRADDSVKEVTNKAGKEVVSTAQLWFDKYPPLSYDDVFVYRDEHGNGFERTPHLIDPIRMINGKPTLTIVYL